jgi:ABC-type spermidine/putrescine transport system permease subunit I
MNPGHRAAPSDPARAGSRLSRLGGRSAVIGVPFLWLLLFFLLPFAVVMKIAVSQMGAVHPEDVVTWQDGVLTLALKFGNFSTIAGDRFTLKVIGFYQSGMADFDNITCFVTLNH